LAGHIRVLAAIIFSINRKPIRTQKQALKPQYVIALFCPFAKIRLNWGYFETEPDTGFFSEVKVVIGGKIEPGWGDLPSTGSGLLRGIFGEPEQRKGDFSSMQILSG
jgi:hypothetical protein